MFSKNSFKDIYFFIFVLDSNMSFAAYTHNKNNTFLKIPAELRIEIFRRVWIFTPLIWTQWMNTPTKLRLARNAQYDDSKPSRGLPQWLLTCQTIFTEGLAELHLMFDSIVGPYDARVSERKQLKHQVIKPAAKKTLTILTDILSTSDKPTLLHGAEFVFSEIGLSTIEHVLEHAFVENYDDFAIKQSRIHILRVKAAFVNVCTYCQWYKRRVDGPELWTLDLSHLERFELKLDVFELEITNVDTKAVQDGYVHSANCWDRAEWAFRKEVRRVGCVLTRDPCGSLSTDPMEALKTTDVIFRFKASNGVRQGFLCGDPILGSFSGCL